MQEKCILMLLLVLSGFSQLNWANGNGTNNPMNFAPTSIQPADIKRDPFTTSNKMYSEMQMQSGVKNGSANGFIPGYGAANVPIMRLKGFVTKVKGKATALLDIEGAGVYMVSKGDQIGLHAIGQNTVLEIMEVTSNGVKVRTGQINQVIVVR